MSNFQLTMFSQRALFAGLLFFLWVIFAFAEDIKLYSDKYDHVSIDEILANDRKRNQYLDCYLEKAPCRTPDAKFFRETFPEALVTKCKFCTERQKDFFAKITEYYLEKEPDTWDIVVRKTITDYSKNPKQ